MNDVQEGYKNTYHNCYTNPSKYTKSSAAGRAGPHHVIAAPAIIAVLQ